jgi:hypothetical protein
MAGKATLGGAQYQLPPQVTGHAQSAHFVSKHSPPANVKEFAASHQPGSDSI